MSDEMVENIIIALLRETNGIAVVNPSCELQGNKRKSIVLD